MSETVVVVVTYVVSYTLIVIYAGSLYVKRRQTGV